MAEKKHRLLVAAWLGLLIFAGIISLIIVLYGISNPRILNLMLGVISLTEVYYSVASALIGLVLIVYIFNWKKIAFYGYVVFGVVNILLSAIVFWHGLLPIGEGIIGVVVTAALVLSEWKKME